MWYARWMQGEIVTGESEVYKQNKDVSNDRAEELFAFGLAARREMRAFTDAAGSDDWEKTHEAVTDSLDLRGSARKLIAHILVHEVRHFAQADGEGRQHNLAPPGDHDLCFSESFGPLITRKVTSDE